MKKFSVICGVLLILAGCSSNKVDFEKMSAEEIYNYAMDELEATRYAKAEAAFEAVETDHPYSQWAVRSKLMGAYAYYKDEKYDDATLAVDRFIKYHPGNKDVPYALYLKGMCYYDQISEADKDQGNTAKAAETFNLLISMYPDSKYAKDAQGKMSLTEDYKAGQEMMIGRYYLHEGNYLSALNRFSVVLENYQTTIQIEEALYREVEIYAIFGMNDYADGYYQILRKNYPNGKWTAKAEKVMNKIGGAKVKKSDKKITESATVKAAETTTEDKEGFFSGMWHKMFGNAKDEAVMTAEDKAAEQSIKETKEAASKAINDELDGVKTEAKPTADAVENEEKTQKDSSGSWFSGWFGGSENKE